MGTVLRYCGWTGNPGGELGLGVGEGAVATRDGVAGGDAPGELLGLDEHELRSSEHKPGADLSDAEQSESESPR